MYSYINISIVERILIKNVRFKIGQNYRSINLKRDPESDR